MNMHWIDWVIVFALLGGVTAVALATKKLMRGVADFLAAGRCAGRYLLSIAQGESGLGAITVLALFERGYTAGFTTAWWFHMMAPVGLLLSLSGFIGYRFRETRALTLAQFLEIRYSKPVRVYAGIVLTFSGILNFGIFPAAGARFFIYFCGLPEMIPGLGISTYPALMVALLAIALFFVFVGGQITVMVTDFIQGIFTSVVFLIILFFLFRAFEWTTLVETLKGSPADASLIHPFHTAKIESFNVFFFIIGIFGSVYTTRAWQGSQGYNSAAKSAHEAKMAGIIGFWRGIVMTLLLMLLPVAAYVVMHSPAYAALAGNVNVSLDAIQSDTIRTQMTVPLVLAKLLPRGILGLFCGVMLAAFISTHDTYLHSWGSIFVQDVIVPFRKKPFAPRQHLWLLRLSILLVAVFIFFFSLLFRQNEFILMFMIATGTIWVGGAGCLIIGGLYWKRGSSRGALAAMTISCVMGVGTMVLRQIWAPCFYPWMADHALWLLNGMTWFLEGVSSRVTGINWQVGPDRFPIDSQWMFLFTAILSIISYVGFSLIDSFIRKQRVFNMDRMLHRGEYAVVGDHEQHVSQPVTGWRALAPSREFTRGDRVLYFMQMFWMLAWFAVFLVGTLYNLTHEVSDDSWGRYWAVYVGIAVVVGIGTTIWFLIGGTRDAVDLFRRLSLTRRDARDDGTVVDHHMLADDPLNNRAAGD